MYHHKPHTAAAMALLCHKHSGHTAYRLQAKLAPTNFDLQLNSHAQPWSAPAFQPSAIALFWSPLPGCGTLTPLQNVMSAPLLTFF